jgi:dolichol-phosphate mannosyltransferase
MNPTAAGPCPRVVVLTPVFNEQASLPAYEKAVRDVLFARTDYAFRVLLIDDGSTDGSWPLIRGLCARDPRFEGVRLSRNFGSHVALSAGFARADADADAVAVLACDLQDPPEVVLEFLAKWRDGAQIVWGRRRTREDPLWRIWVSKGFNALLRRFAMPRGSRFTTGGFILVDRVVADCLRRYEERNRILFALLAWTGFRQEAVEYDRKQRFAGRSGWTLDRMLKAMYDAFIGFSYVPVRVMTWVGLLTFVFAVVLGLYLVINAFTSSPMPGWTSLFVGMAFFSGIQCLLMGLSGEYLHRIYTEVVRRPLYFISEDTRTEEGRRADAA